MSVEQLQSESIDEPSPTFIDRMPSWERAANDSFQDGFQTYDELIKDASYYRMISDYRDLQTVEDRAADSEAVELAKRRRDAALYDYNHPRTLEPKPRTLPQLVLRLVGAGNRP